MKRVVIPPTKSPKPRAHYVLFDKNLPFSPKTEQNKVLYRRNIKHKGRELQG